MTDVNLNEQVLSTIERLRPEITNNNIFFSLIMFTELWMIRTEPGQIQKTLAALVTESCESLPGGGRITIETANRCLSSADSQDDSPDLIPGEYVMLSFSNTGTSSSAAVNIRLAKTLHKVGQPDNNTATTPAAIYEFIRKSGGDIVRHNGHGPGTTVSLFFPSCRQQAANNSTLPLDDSSAMRQLS